MDERSKGTHGRLALPSNRQDGYGGIILDRLARHACRVAGVDRACIFVRDRSDPRVTIAAAGYGIPLDRVGGRQGVDEGMVGTVVATGKPCLVADYDALPPPRNELGAGTGAALAAPIMWRGTLAGVLVLGTSDREASFGSGEVELVCELAEIAAAAIGHAEISERVEPAIQAHVEALATALDMRDRRTSEHSEDVVTIAYEVGEAMRLEPAALLELEYAARLHDVGKLRVRDAILHKPGPLSGEEYEEIKGHPVWGAETLAAIAGLEVVATIVRFHHERWDGSGYPDGLAGERIPLASRIIAACDAWGAMTADRPYREALSCEQALAELRAGSGTQWDPGVVDALAAAIQRSRRPG